MYFSKPEENSETSFFILKSQLVNETCSKRIQQRNQIKINKRKLPSDFFKKTGERSLSRKSPFDSSLNRLSLPRTTHLRKYPQTQRKINSHYDIPSSTQLDHTYDFTLAKTENLRIQDKSRASLSRRALVKQISTNEEYFNPIKTQKYTDYVKPKCLKKKQAAQILETKSELRNLIKQRFPKKFTSNEHPQTVQKSSEQIQMGCTFGKGFKKNSHTSLENSTMLDRQHQVSIEYSKENGKENRYEADTSIGEKSRQDKSTQQSQINEALKSNENSPFRINKDQRHIFAINQTPYFQHPKINRIQWNIYNHDFSFFQDLSLQKSKEVFTAEEKQRKNKYRANNSSNDYRQKGLRKDKKVGEINLPKINKTLNLPSDGQV